MQHLKVHYFVRLTCTTEARDALEREGLVPDKVKFCDGLMLKKERVHDLTKDINHVDCKKCQK